MKEAESDPKTPPSYQEVASPPRPSLLACPVASVELAAPRNAPHPIDYVYHQISHGMAIDVQQHELQHVREELQTLQLDFLGFKDTVTAQFEYVFQHIYSIPLFNGNCNTPNLPDKL